MSYCVALKLNHGLVFMSDTLTNGGVDNISRYPKTFCWGVDGERQIILTTAGNLATSQAVVSILSEQTKVRDKRAPSILEAPTMFQVARIVSQTLADVITSSSRGQQQAESTFSSTFILGGQIKGGEMRLYLIYPEGNFIEVSEEQPFFQIGETKYGRPILVRAFEQKMNFEDAVKLLMVSFDSTIKANLSVGLPLDLNIYEVDSFLSTTSRRITSENSYFQMISQKWGASLKESLYALPTYSLKDDA
jgi:putative proteasome-type protease